MNFLFRFDEKISRRFLLQSFMAWPVLSLVLPGLKSATDISNEIVEINGWILKKGDLA